MNAICSNKEIIHLLGEDQSQYPEDSIPFNKAFPHEFVPETIEKTDRFINFDFRSVLDARNNALKDITIWFWVFCHQDIVRYFEGGRQYLWYDKVVCELDDIFSKQNIWGVGKTRLVGNEPYYPQQKFKGRLITFKVCDFTDGLKYGK